MSKFRVEHGDLVIEYSTPEGEVLGSIPTSDVFRRITKTCTCNIQRFFFAVKIEIHWKNFGKILIFLKFLLKT